MNDPVTLFTLAETVEFTGVVRPGDLVIVTGRKVYFRGNQIKVDCSMTRPDGSEVCSGILAGKGVSRAQFDSEPEQRSVLPIAERTIAEGEGS